MLWLAEVFLVFSIKNLTATRIYFFSSINHRAQTKNDFEALNFAFWQMSNYKISSNIFGPIEGLDIRFMCQCKRCRKLYRCLLIQEVIITKEWNWFIWLLEYTCGHKLFRCKWNINWDRQVHRNVSIREKSFNFRWKSEQFFCLLLFTVIATIIKFGNYPHIWNIFCDELECRPKI